MPATKRTITILMQHIDGRTVQDAVEEDLLSFVETHDGWCRDVSSFYLYHKQVKYDTYAEEFPFFALDGLGLTIWARCYRKHVAIVCNHRFWCTRLDGDFEKCDIVLMYRGKGVFEDTRVMDSDECKDLGPLIAKVQSIMDERELKEDNKKRKTRQSKRRIDKIYSDSEDMDLEEVLETGKAKPKKSRKTIETSSRMTTRSRSRGTAAKVPENPEVTERESETETIENNVQKPDDTPPEVTEKEAANDETIENNVQKSSCHVQISVDDVANVLAYIATQNIPDNNVQNLNQDTEKETEKESDIDGNNNVKTEQKTDNNMQKQDYNVPKTFKNLRNRIVKSSVIAANKLVNKAKSKIKGSWRAAASKRAKDKSLMKVYLCLVPKCPVQKATKAALVKHIKSDHRKFRYTCRHCPKSFLSITGRYKHELYHKYEKEYECKYCDKSFMFKSERADHHRTHTGKDMFVCSFEDCEKSYASKRACTAHEKSHTSEEVYCEELLDDKKTVCNQTCVSKNHLKQHIRGMHGPGWVSPCGKRYSWPSTMYNHKAECKKCKKLAKK